MIFEPRDSGDVTGTQGKKRVNADCFDFDTVSDWRRKYQTAWSMSGPSMPDPSYSCNSSHGNVSDISGFQFVSSGVCSEPQQTRILSLSRKKFG